MLMKLSRILKIFSGIAIATLITTNILAQEPDVVPEEPKASAEGEKGEHLEDLDKLCEELKKLKELLEAEQNTTEE